jgi:hypothetical protein
MTSSSHAAALLGLGLAAVSSAHLQAQIYTNWGDLNGYTVFAEVNPGGGVWTPADQTDARINHNGTYSEVIANPNNRNVYVNAIGYLKWFDRTPDGAGIGLKRYRYVYALRLPRVPSTSTPSGGWNAQNVHQMIQMWDGADRLGNGQRKTREAAIYWQLNPWGSDYGKIYVYGDNNGSLYLHDTGIRLNPDTNWHTFEIRADFATGYYYGIVVDQQYRSLSNVRIARVSQPSWGNDLSLVLTAEAGNTYPGSNNTYKSQWSAQFKDVKLFRDN